MGFDYDESIPNTPSSFSQENLLRKTMDLHAKLHDCMKEVGECFQIPLMFVFIQEFLNIVYSFYIFYGVISYGVAHHGTMEELDFEIYSFTQSYAKVAVMTWCGDALACEVCKQVYVFNEYLVKLQAFILYMRNKHKHSFIASGRKLCNIHICIRLIFSYTNQRY